MKSKFEVKTHFLMPNVYFVWKIENHCLIKIFKADCKPEIFNSPLQLEEIYLLGCKEEEEVIVMCRRLEILVDLGLKYTHG